MAADPVLPDVLAPGLRVVFCGVAPGKVSAALGAYYAKPGNQFWTILAETGMTPRRLMPTEFRQLLQFGIGLTDIAKHAVGVDSAVPDSAIDAVGLKQRLRLARPSIIAFNGKKAASKAMACRTGDLPYGEVVWEKDLPSAFILPSTSGAGRAYWEVAPWFALSKRLKDIAA